MDYLQLVRALDQLMLWVRANGSYDEALALWRDIRSRTSQEIQSHPNWQKIEGIGDVQPGDAAMLEGLFDRLPMELITQLTEAGYVWPRKD